MPLASYRPAVSSFLRLASTGMLAVMLAACSKQAVSTTPAPDSRTGPSGSTVGASSSRAAVEHFMASVKESDLQAMSALWGNDAGPARTRLKRDELEKRLVIMQCLLNHDRWNFVEDAPRLQTAGRQSWLISLTRKRATARTTLTTVRGPGSRWFLENVDVAPLREFCA